MMNVTRDVIIDLLPLYLAGEASQDTSRLVESWLAEDPQLARMARRSAELDLPVDIDVPLQEEDEMKAFKKAKRMMIQHNLFLILAVAFTFMFAIGMTVLLDENPVGPAVFFVLALVFWSAFALVNRRMNR